MREDYYAFPDPPLLRNYDSNSETLPEQSRGATSTAANEVPTTLTHAILGEDSASASLTPYSKTSSKDTDGETAAAILAKTADQTTASTSTEQPLAHSNNSTSNPAEPQIFAGQKVYIASTLKVHANLAGALQKRILAAGAKSCFIAGVEEDQNEEDGDEVAWEEELTKSNYIICYSRSGWEFWRVRIV